MSDLTKWWQVLAHVKSWTRENPQQPLQMDVCLWLRLWKDGKKRPGPSAGSGTRSPE